MKQLTRDFTTSPKTYCVGSSDMMASTWSVVLYRPLSKTRLLNKFTPNFSLASPLYVLFCSNLFQEAVTLILFL